jgi:uncharacterized protein
MNIEEKKEVIKAISQGNCNAISLFFKENLDFLSETGMFGSWLHDAVAAKKLDVIKTLIDLGIDLNARGGQFNSNALKLAANMGDFEIFKYLLDAGSEFNTNEPDQNPLFGAITSGSKEIAKLLIDQGINLSIKYTGERMHNMDALAYAKERGELEIAELIRAELVKLGHK